ncbi:MAG: cytochrome b5 domain-containing protein [Patescibacteria group bacterium]
MQLVYKIIRRTAWLLILSAVVLMISGSAMVKPMLFPGINYQLVFWLHSIVSIFVFGPLFYLHSSAGIFLMLARYPKLNKKYIKIPAVIIWALVIFSFILIYFIPNPLPKQTSNDLTGQTVSTTTKLDLAEVAKHNSASDCWMIIDNKVYNLTNFIGSHSGGAATIIKYCGKDGSIGYATKDRNQPHSTYANSLLNSYYLGDVGQTTSNQQSQNIGNQSPPGGFGENEDEN